MLPDFDRADPIREFRWHRRRVGELLIDLVI
jgi:hypothetical protein